MPKLGNTSPSTSGFKYFSRHWSLAHVIHERQATATDLFRVTQGPQPLPLGLVHEAAHEIAAAGAHLVGEQLVLERIDFPLDEIQHLRTQRLHVLRN
jgi:hypothetical protein